MAEAFGVGAGIAGVIGLTIQIIEVTVKLGLDWKGAPAEARSFIVELQALRTVLSEANSNCIFSKDFEDAFHGRHSALLSQLRPSAHDTDTTIMVSACLAELKSLHEDLLKRAQSHRIGWERLKGAFQATRTREAVENLYRQCQTLNKLLAVDALTLMVGNHRKLTEIEKQQQQIHRAQHRTLDHIRGSINDEKSTREQQTILDWLTPVDYAPQQNDFINRRQEGTGQWLLDSEEFKTWVDGGKPTLLCPGIPGAVYIDSHISHLPSFVQTKPDLQEEIRTGIINAVNGMFLLAQLHLESLNGKKSPKAVRAALMHLATGSEAYNRAYNDAMERIEGQGRDQATLAKQVLSWITCAKRPLTTTELQHALAVEAGESELDEENLSQIEDVVSVCAGLVTVDEESRIIRLVHYTTQEYFQRTQTQWFPTAEKDITEICVTYISFSQFKSGPCSSDEEYELRLQGNPLYKYASQNWGHHARQGSISSFEIIRFLQGDTLVEASNQTRHANKQWTGHLNYSQEFPKLKTGFHLAADFGVVEVFAELVRNGMKIDQKDGGGRTPLSYAAGNGHDAMVQRLLTTGQVNADSRDNDGRTPLSLAAWNGHDTVVQCLLATGQVNADSKDKHGRTPLSLATRDGHNAVVQRLLATGQVDAD